MLVSLFLPPTFFPQIGQKPLYNNRSFWIHRRTACKVNPEIFFIGQPFEQQKRISHSYQGHMMMPSLPRTTLEMVQADLYFHFPIVLFDSKSAFGLADQSPKRNVGSPTGKPIFERLRATFWPFNQKFLRFNFHRLALDQPIGHPDDQTSKPGTKRSFSPFPPGNLFPKSSPKPVPAWF
jgi:hypothetical protein